MTMTPIDPPHALFKRLRAAGPFRRQPSRVSFGLWERPDGTATFKLDIEHEQTRTDPTARQRVAEILRPWAEQASAAFERPAYFCLERKPGRNIPTAAIAGGELHALGAGLYARTEELHPGFLAEVLKEAPVPPGHIRLGGERRLFIHFPSFTAEISGLHEWMGRHWPQSYIDEGDLVAAWARRNALWTAGLADFRIILFPGRAGSAHDRVRKISPQERRRHFDALKALKSLARRDAGDRRSRQAAEAP